MAGLAWITGARGDIGQALSDRFRMAGWRLALSDLHEATESTDPNTTYDRVDVTLSESVHQWVSLRGADGLAEGETACAVINAATVTPARPLELEAEAWRREIDVNLNGAFHTSQAVARWMVRHGVAGHIVFIGSWVADAPDPNIPAYCAAKAGVRMLMRTLARDLAPHRIRVNEVAPGYVDAGLSARMFREDPGLRERCSQRVPLGGLIQASEVADVVLGLVSGELPHMTGSVLTMDGGLGLVGP